MIKSKQLLVDVKLLVENNFQDLVIENYYKYQVTNN